MLIRIRGALDPDSGPLSVLNANVDPLSLSMGNYRLRVEVARIKELEVALHSSKNPYRCIDIKSLMISDLYQVTGIRT